MAATVSKTYTINYDEKFVSANSLVFSKINDNKAALTRFCTNFSRAKNLEAFVDLELNPVVFFRFVQSIQKIGATPVLMRINYKLTIVHQSALLDKKELTLGMERNMFTSGRSGHTINPKQGFKPFDVYVNAFDLLTKKDKALAEVADVIYAKTKLGVDMQSIYDVFTHGNKNIRVVLQDVVSAYQLQPKLQKGHTSDLSFSVFYVTRTEDSIVFEQVTDHVSVPAFKYGFRMRRVEKPSLNLPSSTADILNFILKEREKAMYVHTHRFDDLMMNRGPMCLFCALKFDPNDLQKARAFLFTVPNKPSQDYKKLTPNLFNKVKFLLETVDGESNLVPSEEEMTLIIALGHTDKTPSLYKLHEDADTTTALLAIAADNEGGIRYRSPQDEAGLQTMLRAEPTTTYGLNLSHVFAPIY